MMIMNLAQWNLSAIREMCIITQIKVLTLSSVIIRMKSTIERRINLIHQAISSQFIPPLTTLFTIHHSFNLR